MADQERLNWDDLDNPNSEDYDSLDWPCGLSADFDEEGYNPKFPEAGRTGLATRLERVIDIFNGQVDNLLEYEDRIHGPPQGVVRLGLPRAHEEALINVELIREMKVGRLDLPREYQRLLDLIPSLKNIQQFLDDEPLLSADFEAERLAAVEECCRATKKTLKQLCLCTARTWDEESERLLRELARQVDEHNQVHILTGDQYRNVVRIIIIKRRFRDMASMFGMVVVNILRHNDPLTIAPSGVADDWDTDDWEDPSLAEAQAIVASFHSKEPSTELPEEHEHLRDISHRLTRIQSFLDRAPLLYSNVEGQVFANLEDEVIEEVEDFCGKTEKMLSKLKWYVNELDYRRIRRDWWIPSP